MVKTTILSFVFWQGFLQEMISYLVRLRVGKSTLFFLSNDVAFYWELVTLLRLDYIIQNLLFET